MIREEILSLIDDGTVWFLFTVKTSRSFDFELPKAYLSLWVAYPSLEVQDVFLCCQLLRVYLAHLRLQLVYLLNLAADRWLEKVLETAGLVPNVVLEDEGGVFELADLTLHDFSQIVEVDSVFVNCVSQKSFAR